jgi:O-antigen ligase
MEILSEHKRGVYFEKLHYLLALLLPITPKLLPVIIIAISLLWLLEGAWINKWNAIIENKFFWAFISIYIMYIIGMFYTQNVQHGLRDLETKFSLLLFPLLYTTSKNANKIDVFKLLKFLAIGCFIAAVICLAYATYNFNLELYYRAHNIPLDYYPYTSYFFSSYLSLFLHTGYFSLYINLSIAFLIYEILFNSNKKKWYKAIIIFVLFYLSVFNLMLLSKIGTITMFLMFLFMLYIWARKKYSGVKVLLFIVSIVMLISVLFISMPNVRYNFENAVETALSKNEKELDAEDGSASRLLAWKTATHLIQQHLLTGVGTGDVKQTLTEEYKKKGNWHAYEIQLNSHNQFLQTTLAIGVLGLLCLLFFVFINFKNAIKNKNILHLIFITAVCLQFVVEASLETQAGVIFIAFFNSAFNFIFTNSDLYFKTTQK